MTIELEEETTGALAVISLGEHSRKRIRRLRKGKGKLMDKVEDTVAELKSQGILDKDAQTVVVIVKEEPSLAGLFDDDDDD